MKKLLRSLNFTVLFFCIFTLQLLGQATVNTTTTVIPKTFFGLHYKKANPFPTSKFGTLRLWDSLTRWQLLEPTTSGTYVFTDLDAYLQLMRTHGINDVLLTLSATPKWISSDPSNATCQYNTTNTGSCGVPTDIAASCTNVNTLNNCDGKTDGTNQEWRNFIYNLGTHIEGLDTNTYQPVTSFEVWNEFTDLSATIYAAWEGTNAFASTQPQLVRMAQDANCILTGRGTITSQGNAACTAGNMGVTAVGVLPGVTVTTPDAVMTAPDSTLWGQYIATTGALDSVDIAAVHAYTQGGGCCANGETVKTRFNTANTKMTAVSSTLHMWSTEGGYGQQSPAEPDLDLQAAFLARYYLVGWASGFQRLYWYAWDSPTFGTLWNPNGVNSCNDGGSGLGCITKAGTAYNTMYNWLVGQQMSTFCSVNILGTVNTVGTAVTLASGPSFDLTWSGSLNINGQQVGIASVNSGSSITLSQSVGNQTGSNYGNVWTCNLQTPGTSIISQVVWDTGRTCSAGSCTTVNYTFQGQYISYSSLDGSLTPIVGSTVPIGAKPILLKTRIPAPMGLFFLW